MPKKSFCKVKWCNEDLANALEVKGVEATESNVKELRNEIDNHFFSDYLISCGWDYIYTAIDNKFPFSS